MSCSPAISEIAAMSVSFSVGLAGVSVRISFVFSQTLLRTSSGEEVSANVNSTPKRANTLVQIRYVPP